MKPARASVLRRRPERRAISPREMTPARAKGHACLHVTLRGGLSTTFPSAGIGLVSGGFLGRRGVVVVGNVPMTRSARRDGKYPAMFLLRRRRAPILLQDLPEADGNEESKTSKGKSFCLRRWARHGSAAP